MDMVIVPPFTTGDRVEILGKGGVYAKGVVVRTTNIGRLSQFATVAYDDCPVKQACQTCTSWPGCRTGVHAFAFCRKVTSEE